jgi:hypothetical protein
MSNREDKVTLTAILGFMMIFAFVGGTVLGSGLWLLGAPIVMSYVATTLIGAGVGLFLGVLAEVNNR